MQSDEAALERSTLRKVAWRLIPFMFLLYIFNILDRNNIGIAVLTMKKDLHFSDTVYGAGAGIFFIGYFFFEVPSNLALEKFGARRWIARIVMTWGIIASMLMFVRTPWQFYAVRFLLGVAEAGFFPGMVLYLTYWFPNSLRGRATARFIIAGVVAGIVGNPLGALFLQFDGVGGLHGWQWLFLLEGIPSFLLGFAVLAYMTDKPEHANWLRPEERNWLVAKLEAERRHREKFHHMSLMDAFRYPRVIHLSVLMMLNAVAGAGLLFFQNLVLKQRWNVPDSTIILVGTVPALVAAASLLYFSALSDRTGERRLFVAGGLLLAAVGLAAVAWTRSPLWTVVAICVVNLGIQAQNGAFWALTSGFLTGAAAAGGIAFINSVGNSGTFFGSWLMGLMKDRFHAYEPCLYVLAGIWVLTAIIAYLIPPDPALHPPPAVEPEESR